MDKRLLGLIDFTKTFLLTDKHSWSFDETTSRGVLFDHFYHYHDSTIQFSGTLYNSDTLKRKLSISKDIHDAALIMIAYEKWGTALLKELEGIFSFALFDIKKNLLILAKDRISVQSLYYYHDSHSFLFGTSLKTVSKLDNFSKRLNHAALSNYFTYGYILQPNTIYQNCFKVKSGHFLTFDISNKSIKEEKYWDLGNSYDEPKSTLSEKEFKEEAEVLLKNSIKKRICKDGNYAASLSGGYDSSTIAALLQEQSPKPIKTFTIGFEDASINEAPEAKK